MQKNKLYFSKLGMVMHACNPMLQEAETKPLAYIQVQPYLSSEFPSKQCYIVKEKYFNFVLW